MRKTEVKTCRKCGKLYMWTSGGIVANPKDYADQGMCKNCRIKTAGGVMEKINELFSK